jgi:hypothetical protein
VKKYLFVMKDGETVWEEHYTLEDNQNPKEYIENLLEQFRDFEKIAYGRESKRTCTYYTEVTA